MCGVGGYAMPIHEHRIVLPLLLGRGATVPLVDGAEAVVEQFCVSFNKHPQEGGARYCIAVIIA